MDKIDRKVNEIFSRDNAIHTKLMYFLMFLICVYILIRVIFYIIAYYNTSINDGTVLISSKILGSQKKIISQNPNAAGYKEIMKSKNEKGGLEFTYSLWLNIDPVSLVNTSKYDIHGCLNYIDKNNVEYAPSCTANQTNNHLIHIFSKGNSIGETGTTGDNTLGLAGVKKENNAPGVYLASNRSTGVNRNSVSILIFMDITTSPAYVGDINPPLIITNIPTSKWINICIVVRQPTIYVYLNGILKTSKNYSGNAFKQNFDNITVNNNSTPINWGELSSLVYYNRALKSFEVRNMIEKKPSTIYSEEKDDIFPKYLSMDYYL